MIIHLIQITQTLASQFTTTNFEKNGTFLKNYTLILDMLHHFIDHFDQ